MLLRLVGKEGLTQWTVAKCFKYLMLLTTGVSVEVVEGAEYLGTRPAVYIGNHQSYAHPLTTRRNHVRGYMRHG